MKKQRGEIAPIWLYAAAALILIVALVALIKAWDSYTAGLDKKGYDRGRAECDSAYKQRDNDQLKAANAAKDAAEKRAQAAEKVAAEAQVEASSNYQKGVRDAQAKTAARIAAIRSGDLKLRDPGQVQAGAGASCGSPTGQAAASAAPSGSDGKAGCQLSGTTSEFLFSLTGEADDIARQLAACQAIIRSDRVLVNSWNDIGRPVLTLALTIGAK